MKIRIGFVSNSSSCSFTCPICGNHYEGWDWDEPICPECGINSNNVTETFLDYLARKHNFNIEYERLKFKVEQERKYKEEKRQEYIADHGRDPKYD